MSQHDFDIANQGFPATRADINNALQAAVSNSAGPSAPLTTYAYQFWYDSTNNIIKIRNGDNDAWISLMTLDQAGDLVTRFDVDNIRLDGNTISSTDTNGDITLDPDGTGNLIVESGNVVIDSNGRVSINETGTHNDANEFLLIKNTDGAANLSIVADNAQHSTLNLGDEDDFSEGRIRYQHSDDSMRFHTADLERLRIDGSGQIFFGTTDASMYNNSGAGNGGVTINAANGYAKGLVACARDSGAPLDLNRLVDDGYLISFSQDGSREGTISVSGSTVSYNGGHLSRWSQATDGNRIDGLVKGTVMTNLDQMAVWHHEAQPATYYEEGDELPEGVSVGDEKTPAVAAYDEKNEQLNCMAVSSVEGDANVAGVFVNWDNDDEDYAADMNIAMTGDMVIRIASGTTIARGDLLMSAGDGTAKPQGDDIVRSKTIAKVTSTTVSHTYDDGSYLVPCVLMAC